MKYIDDFLNQITMYRLVLYVLIGLISAAGWFSIIGVLHYSFINLAAGVTVLTIVCLLTNEIFARVYRVNTNYESVYITALILALIINPPKTAHDVIFLFWAAVWAMASKYIFAVGKKHIFNPVAIAVTITAYGINQSATWWVGNLPMMFFVIAGGLLIVRKIKRYEVVGSFLAVLILFNLSLTGLEKTFVLSPALFFVFIMLTEPLTMPPAKLDQIIYGAIAGVLFNPRIHLGGLYSTPETALMAGNLWAFLVSPKDKLILTLSQKIQLAPDIYDFVFKPSQKLNFLPGQYLEWTLPNEKVDTRGNRRYFTLASSPTENDLRVGVKFNPNASSYKQNLLNLDEKTEIAAGQLAGEFTLPKDPHKKLVLIAGGIGVTPYRSMIKYLIDRKEKRDIIIVYDVKNPEEFVYKDVFDQAERELGIKTVYQVGHLEWSVVQNAVPDYKKRIFYLSGPRGLVEGFKEILSGAGVPRSHVKTDYFPGFV